MKKIKKTLKQLIGLLPHELPHLGLQDMDKFCDTIFATYDLPDMPSYRQAICTMIMHLSPTVHKKSLYFFAKSVKKAMANQIAFEKIQLLKKEENEYAKAVEENMGPKA